MVSQPLANSKNIISIQQTCVQSCSLEYEYKTKLPSYEECMMAEPCKVKLDVEIHKAAAEKNMITM